VESGNPNIEIKMLSRGRGSTGSVRVELLLPSESGLNPREQYFFLDSAVKDVGGKWNRNYDPASLVTFRHDGILELFDIPPGSYVLEGDSGRGYRLVGAGNVWVRSSRFGDQGAIAFPVKAGKQAYIRIHLSVLKVGLLLQDGSAAHDHFIKIICQTSWEGCEDPGYERSIGPDGFATFYVVPGRYDLLFTGYESLVNACYRFSKVSVGEVGKYQIITMILKASEADVTGPWSSSCGTWD